MQFIPNTVAEVRSWSRNIRLFFLANIFYQIGSGLFSLLYNLYIQGLGYGDTMNGRVVSVQSLATALMFVPIGLIGDRSSRKRLLIIGSLFSGILFLGRSFLGSESSLITLSVAVGLFASIFQVLAIPFLAENISKAQRLRMFSFFSSVVLASQVFGSMGGGFLADLFQAMGATRLVSLRIVLLIGSLTTFAAVIPLLFITESPRGASPDASAASKSTDAARAGNDDRSSLKEGIGIGTQGRTKDFKFISQFIIAQLLIGLGSGLVVPYLNLYFTNRFSVSLSAMSILISLGQVMTIVSMLIGPSLAARVGPVKAVVIFQLLSLPFLMLTGFTNLLAVASISFLFRQALMNAANPIQSSIMIDRVSDRRRGVANSLMQTAFMLGWATMGPVQSYFVTTHGTYWGYAYTFSITGGLYIIASLMYFFMFRDRTARPVKAAA
ncbi:MFS transporter [Paenibacillus sp. J22TS3]|uniref:MFS transporter n=1 Tax=Paenibacillus sp. J22TS3 TaxID=2807192 RepID=UPI001B02BB1A|nr:MFS transporter [Paenibacillus sp. J22TS3]GIP23922.1 MFS transporter [Paenibacillus sp. J22TS3]